MAEAADRIGHLDPVGAGLLEHLTAQLAKHALGGLRLRAGERLEGLAGFTRIGGAAREQHADQDQHRDQTDCDNCGNRHQHRHQIDRDHGQSDVAKCGQRRTVNHTFQAEPAGDHRQRGAGEHGQRHRTPAR